MSVHSPYIKKSTTPKGTPISILITTYYNTNSSIDSNDKTYLDISTYQDIFQVDVSGVDHGEIRSPREADFDFL